MDTTLDAVQQAIADQRRDDAPAATLMLAPISVVGVAGVVVIAILLVQHRDRAARAGRRRRRRFDPRRERVFARRVPTRRVPGRRGWGERGGRAGQDEQRQLARAVRRRRWRRVKRRSVHLRDALGDGRRERRRDGDFFTEGSGCCWFQNGERWKPGFRERDGCMVKRRMVKRRFVSGCVEPRARGVGFRRALLLVARLGAARVRAKDAPRAAGGGETTRCARRRANAPAAASPSGGGSIPGERVAARRRRRRRRTSPARFRRWPARSRRRRCADRGGRRQKPLDALANGFASQVVPARQEVGRLPPSSFADPVSAPGSPEHRAASPPGRASSPTSTAISAEARRRFQQAAATSARARVCGAAAAPRRCRRGRRQ